MLQEYLGDIRRELLKVNPEVLCQSIVQGGSTISDTLPHTVRFELGGSPVYAYKTYLWNQTGVPVTASFIGMSVASDGFDIPSSGVVLDVPIHELSICLGSAGTVIVNSSTGNATNGALFVYGWTIPSYLNRRDYGEGSL